MTSREDPTFRRLVVALGASRASLATLGTWADLAARLHADLAGLFVEDADLMRMAGLPFARVVGYGSVARAFDAETCERLLRSAQAEARALLETLARQRSLSWSFRAVRGAVTTALVTNVESGDLVVLEHAVFGAAAVHALRAGDASVLYLRPDVQRGREVFVVAKEGEEPALAAGAQLAAASGRGLALLVRADRPERESEAAASAARVVPADVPMRVLRVPEGVPLARILEQERGAILVASAETAADVLGAGGDEPTLGFSVLLVRPRAAEGEAEPQGRGERSSG